MKDSCSCRPWLDFIKSSLNLQPPYVEWGLNPDYVQATISYCFAEESLLQKEHLLFHAGKFSSDDCKKWHIGVSELGLCSLRLKMIPLHTMMFDPPRESLYDAGISIVFTSPSPTPCSATCVRFTCSTQKKNQQFCIQKNFLANFEENNLLCGSV